MQNNEQQIAQAYQQYLGRTAAPNEIQWHAREAAGWGIARTLNIIKNSPEAKSRAAGGGVPPAAAPAPAPQPPDPYAAAVTAGMGELQGFDQSQELPIDIYNKALAQYGVVDARTRVAVMRARLMDTENMLSRVEGNVTQRTAGSVVTEAQRQRLVATESQPLQKAIGDIGRTLEATMADYGMALGEAGKATEYTIAGNNQKRQAILDRLAKNIELSRDETQKRQWQAEFNQRQAEFAQQQALEQAKLAETIRANRASEAQAASNAARSSGGGGGGGGGGGSSGSSATSVKQGVISKIQGSLRATVGKDGYVAPWNYSAAANDWVQAGYSLKEFNNYFGNLKNPNNPNYPKF